MELHPADQLSAGVAALLRRYLARLPLAPERRAALLADALQCAHDAGDALGRLHTALSAAAANSANAAYATIGARVRLATARQGAAANAIQCHDIHGRERLETTPRLARSPMAPHA